MEASPYCFGRNLSSPLNKKVTVNKSSLRFSYNKSEEMFRTSPFNMYTESHGRLGSRLLHVRPDCDTGHFSVI